MLARLPKNLTKIPNLKPSNPRGSSGLFTAQLLLHVVRQFLRVLVLPFEVVESFEGLARLLTLAQTGVKTAELVIGLGQVWLVAYRDLQLADSPLGEIRVAGVRQKLAEFLAFGSLRLGPAPAGSPPSPEG